MDQGSQVQGDQWRECYFPSAHPPPELVHPLTCGTFTLHGMVLLALAWYEPMASPHCVRESPAIVGRSMFHC